MDQAVRYIKKHLKKGFSRDDICNAFQSSGWSPELVDHAFNLHESGLDKKYFFVSISLIILIVIGSALVFFLSGTLSHPTGYALYPMSCLVQDKSNQNFYHFVFSERTCCNLLINSACGAINAFDIRDNSQHLLFSANIKCDGGYNILINDYTLRRCTDPTYDNQDMFNL